MATDFKLPFLGEGIKNAGVVKVFVSEGQTIKAEEPVLEVETDKAAIEVPSSVGGKISKVHIKTGDKVDVGALILTFEHAEGGEQPVAAAESKPPAPPAEKPKPPEKQAAAVPPTPAPAAAVARPAEASSAAHASPTVRGFAREIGIDIMQVPGSGPAGRISSEDVKAFAKKKMQGITASPQARPAEFRQAAILPDFSKWGPIERTAMSNVRTKTAEHLSTAWATIPHVTQFDKADMTELELLRQRFSKKAEAAGGKLTVTAIIMKVVASALKVFPHFNASLDMAANEIVTKKYIHIGVAVDTDRGLLVPVIRDVDRKNIIEIAVELHHIAERARTKKITLDEMQGGTFTISNLGGIGGTGFTPIINSPEVAILGIARSSMEPIWIGGKFEPRQMLPLSLSYDHRAIDGADGARFLRWIVDALEQPFLISLEG